MSDRDRDPLHIGRDVLEREAQALLTVRDRLGPSFAEAVALLESTGGRILVTGVGKSGAIGAKIAATLTSIGSPATYLHPTDALHGDLGIVREGDVLLAISKSGGSAEILDMVPHVRRRGARILVVVQDAGSPLAREADVAIALGPLEEACSLDLVPTSSTTATLAVGDALAVALLRRRGLTQEDFAFVHPGGLIGRRIASRVRELMHGGDQLPVVSVDATLRDGLVTIVEKGLGMTTVTDATGRLRGVLTDGDLKRILLAPGGDQAMAAPIATVMTASPRTIDPEALIATAVRRMEAREPGPVTSLVVVESGEPVGILHLHDCLRLDGNRPAS